VFTKTGITFSYEVRFLRMTTQIVQKKHVHLNTFAKNQGRATAYLALLGASPLEPFLPVLRDNSRIPGRGRRRLGRAAEEAELGRRRPPRLGERWLGVD
jgi:hypothetical protein